MKFVLCLSFHQNLLKKLILSHHLSFLKFVIFNKNNRKILLFGNIDKGYEHEIYRKMSNYKTLKTMMDKMNAQLNLAAKIQAVDEADVAYKVIERHFLPDILGNMRAFSKQSVRCPNCNIIYRRPPLQGVCTKCGGKLTLTVHEKSVKKYLEISKEIAQRYSIPSYAQQRIILVEKSINSLFTSDKVKTTKITDFL